jgi:O-antigen/teichoic acid export membrane protein
VSSYRQILKSSTLTGGASLIAIVLGIVKVKALAVLLGPAGVGLMGLYQNIVTLAATVAGCGIGSSGVRQLASASSDANTLAIVRKALWLANSLLGLAGMFVLWAAREEVAILVFGNRERIAEVGWLGVGVLLTLIAGSQSALLQGLRRIGDLAFVKIIGAFFGAVVGVGLVWMLGETGVLWFVISAPAVSAVVAAYFAAKLSRARISNDWKSLRKQWGEMLKQGIPFMGAALLTVVTQFLVRTLVSREIGLDASGYFQAAWAISTTYLGFVLGSMGADYYPRLTQSIKDQASAQKIVHEQMLAATLLAAPVLTAMVAFAPWVIAMLYSAEFSPAAEILRWQVLGAVLKVICWPMGFVILARGRSTIFLFTEFTWNAVYLGSVYFAIEALGVLVTGIAFFGAYVIYLLVLVGMVWRLLGFRVSVNVWVVASSVLSIGAGVMYFSDEHSLVTALIGLVATCAVGSYSFWRLNSLMDFRSLISRKIKSKK